MRRIVFLSPGHSGPGGVAHRSRLLSSALAERGWRVLVIARATPSRRPQFSRDGALTVVEVPGFGVDRLGTLLFLSCAVPMGAAWGLFGASFLAIKLFSSSTAAAVCGALSGRPFGALATSGGDHGEVLHLLGIDREMRGPRWRRRVEDVGLSLRRRLLRRAAFVVAQSGSAAEQLAELVPAERIVVIPNPVRSVSAPPLTGAPNAVFTGRITRQKDPLGLLEAWRLVVARRGDARLTIVGDGGEVEPMEMEVRQRVATDEDLRATVQFTGWVSDVSPYLSTSDVFVLPSLFEGMANSLLEACAWGRVVVASDIAANRAVVGDDYPLLFPAGDCRALAGALLRAFDDEEIRSEALARIRQRMPAFSMDAVMARLDEVIRSADRSAGRGLAGTAPPAAAS